MNDPEGVPMSEPVERVARTLWELAQSSTIGEPDKDWHDFLPQAHAIIDALREPSPMMIEAGSEIIMADAPDLSDVAARDDAANIWRTMIDTSLIAD
jgi:hypothetical protein